MKNLSKFTIFIKIIQFLLGLCILISSTYRFILFNERNELNEINRIISKTNIQLFTFIHTFKNTQKIDIPIGPDLEQKILKIIENPNIKVEEVFQSMKKNDFNK